MMLPFMVLDGLIDGSLYGRGSIGQYLIIGLGAERCSLLTLRGLASRYRGPYGGLVTFLYAQGFIRRRRPVPEVLMRQQPGNQRHRRHDHDDSQLPTGARHLS